MTPAEIEVRLESLFERATAELAGGPPPFLWRRVRTPPLPLAWPPTRETRWVLYEAAHGFDPSRLTDAVRVAAPFARLRLDRQGRVVAVEPLPGAPRELAPQGVAPVDPPSGLLDAAFEQRVVEHAAALTGLPEPGSPAEGELRGWVATWLRRNGVLAAELRSGHAAFFAWLGLDGEARR